MAAILADLASALPRRVLTNDELAAGHPRWTAASIEEKTGIRARHLAADGECASDLAVAAAEALFARGGLHRDAVDYVLLCTQSPDYLLPTTACLVQERLGLPRTVGALDFNLGCSGYVAGLSLAKGLVESEQAENVLLLTAETYSKFLHPGDFSVRTLFGDGATATWVRRGPPGTGLGRFVFGTDGRGGPNLIVRTGGLREPRRAEPAVETTDESGNVRSADHLFMDGGEVFDFTLKAVPDAVRRLLDAEGCALSDVDLFVFHQANAFMLEHLRRKLRIPAERFVVALRDVGNTVSNTIPLALEAARREGRLHDGARVALVGFGVGYSTAACMLRWTTGDGAKTP